MLFQVKEKDKYSSARTGIISTQHGIIETPCFMPVGTQGTVKTLSPKELADCGAQIILGNTYYLYLRPGDELIREACGIHRFIGWKGAVLTDSGGFQVFSLADLIKITDEGVKFQSHWDGSYHFFDPLKVIQIQRNLGSDIIMALDYPVAYPAPESETEKSTEITVKWARESLRHIYNSQPVYDFDQALFGIIQGGFDPIWRERCINEMLELDFSGYAIGGLSVGEPKNLLWEITEVCTIKLPAEKPRYLMGVGKPEDLVEGVRLGIDMFDCVIPTRNGRNGTVYTSQGKIVIKNSVYRDDFNPVDEACGCYVCQNFSRAYLRHLFHAQEMLALRLASLHNIYFYIQLMRSMREAIINNRFSEWEKEFFKNYKTDGDEQ